jgi:hypothetical protein
MRLMERATMLQSVNSELQEKNTVLESRWGGTSLAGMGDIVFGRVSKKE